MWSCGDFMILRYLILVAMPLSDKLLHPSQAGQHIPELSRLHCNWNRGVGLRAVHGSGCGVRATGTHSKGEVKDIHASLHPLVCRAGVRVFTF